MMRRKILLQSKRGLKSEIMMRNVLNAREWKRNVQSVNGLNLTLSRLLFRREPDYSACLGLNQSLDRC